MLLAPIAFMTLRVGLQVFPQVVAIWRADLNPDPNCASEPGTAAVSRIGKSRAAIG